MLRGTSVTEQAARPWIIVIGNEKGGSGKSTSAMHVLISLAQRGRRVAAIDLDGRQRSLTRYLENRAAHCKDQGLSLVQPPIITVERSEEETTQDAKRDERKRFTDALETLAAEHDTIMIDCPGSDTYLARYAHAHADTLITPVNDSFVDLDLFARIDSDTYKVKAPSLYAEMVWEARKWRAVADGGQIDWLVLRNRMPVQRSRNKARIQEVMDLLAKRIGFRHVPGLSERVVFRELFLKGLTLMDLSDSGIVGGLRNSMSLVSARAEVRRLVEAVLSAEKATSGTGVPGAPSASAGTGRRMFAG
nr:division plane positioning ATPase MipZ [Rhodothalassium salexigens]